jgi:hypothetical protein
MRTSLIKSLPLLLLFLTACQTPTPTAVHSPTEKFAAGSWYRRDGYDHIRLDLQKDGSYNVIWHSHLGPAGTTRGLWKFIPQNGNVQTHVTLSPTSEHGLFTIYRLRRLDFINYSGEWLLLPDYDLKRFEKNGGSGSSLFQKDYSKSSQTGK